MQQTMTSPSFVQPQFEKDYDSTIEVCNLCAQECLRCLHHCVDKGGENIYSPHLSLLIECARVCEATAGLIALEGDHAYEMAQVCAKVCDECAASCVTLNVDDEMVKYCGEVCRRCAQACRELNALG